METAEVIIARLVLGYLKEEKCRTAYKEFLKTSEHLQSDSLTRTKYLPTRFVGLTLENILTEYFEISRIVQGRLECTNYYNEGHSRTSLIEQLLYLLNKGQSSRTSTPCPRSPSESNLDETSPSHIGHISDVETTPAHTLPGNVRCTSEDSYLYKNTRRKSLPKLNNSTTVSSLQLADNEDMSEVLAHTLLENREFHEKIAQTINKVAEKQFRVSSELDRTIKTVVEETEADPIFDRILDEIIGSSATIENCSNGIETGSSASSTAKDTTDHFENKSKRTQKCSEPDQSLEDCQGLRLHKNSETVKRQNEEAIRSIVDNSKNKNIEGNDQEAQMNNDVMIYDGTLDKYLKSNTCNVNTQTQALENPLYIKTNSNVVMVPSTVPPPNYYFVNNTEIFRWDFKTCTDIPNIVTNQDILAMPTVIVNDDRRKISEPLLQAPILQSVKHDPALPIIVSNPPLGMPVKYLSTYRRKRRKGMKVIYPKRKTAEEIQVPSAREVISSASCETNILNADEEKSTSENLLNKIEKPLPGTTDTSHINTEQVQTTAKSMIEILTTPAVIEHVQKTPKNGSHIRNLDFSSPPKITSTHKKSIKNKADSRVANKSESPPFIHKKQAAKTLLSSKKTIPIDKEKAPHDVKELRNDLKNGSKTWDADLRAVIQPEKDEEVKNGSPKRKRRTPVKKIKRRVKKDELTKKKLDTTENNAALIEAALQTPIKSESEKLNNTNDTEIDDHKININTTSKEEENCNSVVSSESQIPSTNYADYSTNKTVLSPSKLNANKRELVSLDNIDNCVVSSLVKSVDETDKFITPEMVKENFHYPIKANRNITSMFDTPLKNDSLPKTPGVMTPNTTLNTPFTKMLEANLKGIDITSLPTPNIPITPNFPPFTPNIEESSPYSNRPTDYSTSSSYYQPSDSEPNRSLEANIIELEKRPVTILSDVVISKDNVEDNKSDIVDNKINSTKSSVNEHVKIFNKSIIGKKNLNLMERRMSTTSSSSEDSSSESNDEDIDSCWIEKSNQTIIYNKKSMETPKRVYSLRNRTTTINKKDVTVKTETGENDLTHKKQIDRDTKTNKRKGTNPIKKCVPLEHEVSSNSTHEKLIDETEQKESKITTDEKIMDRKSTENCSLQQEMLKKELNEKLLRTINTIKNNERPANRKNSRATKTSNSNFMKIKLSNVTKSKRKAKSESSKKTIQRRAKNVVDENSSGDPNTDQISSCTSKKNQQRSRTKKVSNIQITKDLEKSDKSASDIEAQNLIEGLKERELDKDPKPVTDSTVDVTENKCIEEDKLERSTSELETEWRETYDTKLYEEEHICIVFDDSKKITKTFDDFDTKVLEKTFVGKVFIEEINEETDIPLVVSPFYSLLDIQPSKNLQRKPSTCHTNRANDKKEEKLTSKHTIQTDTTKDVDSQHNPVSDGAINSRPGSSRRISEELEHPSLKKRRVEKEDYRVPEEKECQSLLQQINVDTFLNNIYGKSS